MASVPPEKSSMRPMLTYMDDAKNPGTSVLLNDQPFVDRVLCAYLAFLRLF